MFVCICFPCQRFCCHSNPRRDSETVQARCSVMGARGLGWQSLVFKLLSDYCCGFHVCLLINDCNGHQSVSEIPQISSVERLA